MKKQANSFLFQEYLEKSGLMYLFPRVISYIINPDGPSFFGQESLLQGMKLYCLQLKFPLNVGFP